MPGRPARRRLSGSAWFAGEWNADLPILSAIRDGTINALFLGYSGIPSVGSDAVAALCKLP